MCFGTRLEQVVGPPFTLGRRDAAVVAGQPGPLPRRGSDHGRPEDDVPVTRSEPAPVGDLSAAQGVGHLGLDLGG